jgi:hypothetical protein
VIVLFGPKHAGKSLAHYVLRIRRQILRNYRSVIFVGFTLALRKDFVEAFKCISALEI